jgi:BirA family biotin operon repressor/biotin-[acetyl-CoA-carboxylase] ligase
MKQQILQYLKLNEDKYISGEMLSNKFSVSRTAIWKHINTLRKEGYQISSSTNLGYRLEGVPDIISAEEIRQKLNTNALGRTIHLFKQTESTNMAAKKLAQQDAPHGTIIIAEEQTKGRGRLGRQWVSLCGGLWFSIILRPAMHPADCPGLTMLSGLAVAKAIRKLFALPAMLKWPNDVLIEKRKVCGILTEMGAEMDKVHYVIIGIGINTNFEIKDLPEDLQSTATTLKEELKHDISRTELLTTILEELETILTSTDGLLVNALQSIKDLSCTIGTRVKINSGHTRMEGMALDITEKGSLLVKTDDGSIQEIIAGDIIPF